MGSTLPTPVNGARLDRIPAQPQGDRQPLRKWVAKIWRGAQIVETCPSFCTDSHHVDRELGGHLVDLAHGTYFPGTKVHVFDAEQGTAAMPILAGRINVDPYSDDPRRNVPHINFEPWQDEVMECLDADQFAAVIEQVRAQVERLEQVHAQLLQARAEWQERQA